MTKLAWQARHDTCRADGCSHWTDSYLNLVYTWYDTDEVCTRRNKVWIMTFSVNTFKRIILTWALYSLSFSVKLNTFLYPTFKLLFHWCYFVPSISKFLKSEENISSKLAFNQSILCQCSIHFSLPLNLLYAIWQKIDIHCFGGAIDLHQNLKVIKGREYDYCGTSAFWCTNKPLILTLIIRLT